MFTKLYSQIVTSSIWNEPNHVRLLWVTMLALADENGYVGASVGGLAHTARMTRGECEDALKILAGPDSDSRTKDFDGRRIGEADGGWFILNYEKFRARRDREERKEYMREYMREYRKNHKK